MARNLQAKKSNFLSNLVTAAQSMYDARNALKKLAEEWNSNSDISGITQADIDATTLNWLTPTIIANLITVFQPDLERILAGTAATPSAPELAEILKVISA